MGEYFPTDFSERVYAGVLGKVIGVYLGRPFEGWTYERIQERLGDIEDYVHEELGVPLIVTDDDISGTFTFLRAMEDHGYNPQITSEEIGQSWLNYLIENRTILWWGGLGNSTEHTAYLRLKSGIEAPRSGSEALNGKVVAEQIGAQIFIDGWAMVSPGDPDQAAYLAEQAARVSHDGEAVYGAIVLAVMESQAFVDSDTNNLLDLAVGYIPADSTIRRLIDDVREWHAAEPDWRKTREQIEARYGYDKYGGNCHMVPNHGLIVHALLHGNDNFSETMKIINTCGWDTDCNSGNVGCLMGLKLGLEGIDPRWRDPVADRIYIPTADPSSSISDCATEAHRIVDVARRMQRKAETSRDPGFYFDLPGAVQGFMVTHGTGVVRHQDGALSLSASEPARFGSPVFAPSKDVAKFFEKGGYALLSSPRVYPGQVLTARISGDTPVRLYAAYYGENDQPTFVYSDPCVTGDTQLQIPPEAHPVFELGVETEDAGGTVLESMSWSGRPEVTFTGPTLGEENKATMWRRAWVNGMDEFLSWQEPIRVIHNQGRGLLIQGTRDWRDYTVTADITPHLAAACGIAGRVQGMRRYYGLLLHRDQELRLVCVNHEEAVLAHCDFDWSFGDRYELSLRFDGNRIIGSANGRDLLEAIDESLDCGGVALVIEEGRSATHEVRVT